MQQLSTFYQIEKKNWKSHQMGWFSELFGHDESVSLFGLHNHRAKGVGISCPTFAGCVHRFTNIDPFSLFQIQYSDHHSQFAFLQVMSQRASQTITYHCKNSVAWLDEKLNNHDKSIRLLALNGYEYSKDGHTNAQPKVLKDECKVRKSFPYHE